MAFKFNHILIITISIAAAAVSIACKSSSSGTSTRKSQDIVGAPSRTFYIEGSEYSFTITGKTGHLRLQGVAEDIAISEANPKNVDPKSKRPCNNCEVFASGTIQSIERLKGNTYVTIITGNIATVYEYRNNSMGAPIGAVGAWKASR